MSSHPPPRGASSQHQEEPENVPLTSMADPPDSPTIYRSISSDNFYTDNSPPQLQGPTFPIPTGVSGARSSSPAPLMQLTAASSPPYDRPTSPLSRGPSTSPYLSAAALVPLPTSPNHLNDSFRDSVRSSSSPSSASPSPAYANNPFSPPLPSFANHQHPDRRSSSTSGDSYSTFQQQQRQQTDAAGFPLAPGATPSPRYSSPLPGDGVSSRGSYFPYDSNASINERGYSFGPPSEADASSTRRLYTGQTSSYYGNGPPSPNPNIPPGSPSLYGTHIPSGLNYSSGANESSIWGETADGDEKGYYGALNKGVTSAEAQRNAAERAGAGPGAGARGWKRHGAKNWSSKKKWVVALGGAGLGE